MTADKCRALALSFPDTAESSHMNQPDFRVGGKIFARLGHPSRDRGVVGLTSEDQQYFCRTEGLTLWHFRAASQLAARRVGARALCQEPCRGV